MTDTAANGDYDARLDQTIEFLEMLEDACVEQVRVPEAVILAPALDLLRRLRDVDQVEAAHAG